jgi:phage antirepressor YoqD-like protein
MDKQLITIQGVRGYIDEDGIAQLDLEDVARGLGFTQIAASGNEVVRWERVNNYLSEIGFIPTSGDGKKSHYADKRDGFIPENIFYRLAMKAKNEIAEKFQAKVADEILPSIRKHGAYMTDRTIEKALTDPDFLIQLATQLKDEKQKRVEAEHKVKELAPAAEFGNAIGNCQDSILIRDYAKVLANAGIKIGQDRLFSWLNAKGYIYRDKTSGDWRPMQRFVDQGLFRVKETKFSTSSHGDRISFTTKVTGKGQKYFYEKLKTTA